MDIFFKFIYFFKNFFKIDSGVEYIPFNGILIKEFKLYVVTRHNTYDNDIVTRRYRIDNYMDQREILNFNDWFSRKTALKQICRDFVSVIEKQSGTKIHYKKLYKAVKDQYIGMIKIGDITIKLTCTYDY